MCGGRDASSGMDEYWRQIGIEVMRFLSVGRKGVGMETGKDGVVSGMEAVDIGDSGPVVMADVNSKVFVRAEWLGKAWLQAALQELNEEVKAGMEQVTGDRQQRCEATWWRRAVAWQGWLTLATRTG